MGSSHTGGISMKRSTFPRISRIGLSLAAAFIALPSGIAWPSDAHAHDKAHGAHDGERTHAEPAAKPKTAKANKAGKHRPAKSRGADHGHAGAASAQTA